MIQAATNRLVARMIFCQLPSLAEAAGVIASGADGVCAKFVAAKADYKLVMTRVLFMTFFLFD